MTEIIEDEEQGSSRSQPVLSPESDTAEAAAPMEAASFQARVQPWMMACFGAEIAADRLERNDRFIEEALELVQASGYDKARAYQLVDYVYGRPQGEINQEVGGVMITLAAHCLAHGVDMHAAGETELVRIWTKVEQIREKQKTKPKGSALPVAAGAGGEAVRSGQLRDEKSTSPIETEQRERVVVADLAEALTMTGCRDVADLIDMANVGRSMMDRMAEATAEGPLKGWAPADDPAEIVTDLRNALDDALHDYGNADSEARPLNASTRNTAAASTPKPPISSQPPKPVSGC